MRKILLALSIALLAACATTYVPPATVAPQVSANVRASKADILRTAKQVLVMQGYQITNSDDSAGVISTAPTNMHVTPAQANCGTTMGIDYLKDSRTSTQVSIGVLARDREVIVKANILGEYKPGDVVQNITLTCVSRGTIEGDLLQMIMANLPK